MKKWTMLAAMLLSTAAFCLADQWTGWITDQKCAEAGKYAGEQHKKCVESGAAVVFVNDADKKIYKITEPDKVKAHVGEKVTMDATAKGDTLEIENISAAPAGQ